MLVYSEGRLIDVATFHIESGLIQEIFIQVNPEKLPTPL
jgi:hypothetical protein